MSEQEILRFKIDPDLFERHSSTSSISANRRA
jgi:hypothetical protein